MPSSSLHFIVAEDQPKLRDLYLRLLASAFPDAVVTGVANGQEAYAVFVARGADVIVTDHTMPGGSGLELVQLLRGSGANVPILMLSADSTVEQAALGAGVTIFALKPITMGEFVRTVTSLLLS